MHINLSPEMERFIGNLVESGEYGDATEVIKDAVRRLKTQEMRKAAWQQAIERGEEVGADAGRDIPYTADTAEQVARAAHVADCDSRPMDRDVLP